VISMRATMPASVPSSLMTKGEMDVLLEHHPNGLHRGIASLHRELVERRARRTSCAHGWAVAHVFRFPRVSSPRFSQRLPAEEAARPGPGNG
jgi:hypothetical protein